MGTIDICIGNYGSYNAGYLIDRWVSLPMEPEQLEKVLSDIQQQAEALTGGPCEEMYVSDYDGMPLGLSYGKALSEYTSIDELNLLAQLIEEMPDDAERLEAAIGCGIDEPDTVLEACNWIIQGDDIPYYGYDLDLSLFQGDSPATKMGWSCAKQNGLRALLEENEIECFFDFERYGLEMGQNCLLGEEGYVDNCQDMPSKDLYTFEEIKRMVGWDRDEELSEDVEQAPPVHGGI